MFVHPLFAANAAVYAIQNATTEGKITVIALLVLSLFSWTIIITKFRQLMIARKATKKFFAAYSSTRDPLDIQRKGEEFDGAPAYQLYIRGADELAYQLKNNPVQVQAITRLNPVEGVEHTNTDYLAKSTTVKISMASFEAVKVILEEAAGGEAMALEKGHDCAVHGGGGRAVHRVAGHGLGRHVHLRGHCRKQGRHAHGHGARRGGRAGGHGHRPAGGHPGHVRLQLHGHHHPRTSPRNWTGLPAVTPTRLNTSMWITARWPRKSGTPTKCWPGASSAR